MNVFRKKQFGEIVAYEAGFGPLVPPLLTVHVYRIGGILIDTGQRRMRKAIVNALTDGRLDLILLTHHHEDHSGNAAVLSRRHGVPVLGHAITAEKMKHGYSILPYQRYTWGKADPLNVTTLDGTIDAGGLEFTPVHTPGHSKDHTVFWEKHRGWLFSGDLYLGDRIRYFRADESMNDQIDSLKKVLGLDFDRLMCAHRPRPADGKRYLKRKLDFLVNLRGEIIERLEKGYSETAVIEEMKDREDKLVKLICLGNVSFANMIRATVREVGLPGV